jgi:hypothetical protein
VMLLLHDALGRTVRQLREQPQGAPIAVDLQGLPAGLYWFHATDDSGRQTSGRLIISDF